MPLRLIFMGTPDFSVPTLRALAGQDHDIAAVYTRAAKPGGRRGLELVPSPVEREAKRLGLAVHTPVSLKGAEAQAAFAAYRADAAIVVAYGRKRFTLHPQTAHVGWDVKGSVDEAIARSREGNIFTRTWHLAGPLEKLQRSEPLSQSPSNDVGFFSKRWLDIFAI